MLGKRAVLVCMMSFLVCGPMDIEALNKKNVTAGVIGGASGIGLTGVGIGIGVGIGSLLYPGKNAQNISAPKAGSPDTKAVSTALSPDTNEYNAFTEDVGEPIDPQFTFKDMNKPADRLAGELDTSSGAKQIIKEDDDDRGDSFHDPKDLIDNLGNRYDALQGDLLQQMKEFESSQSNNQDSTTTTSAKKVEGEEDKTAEQEAAALQNESISGQTANNGPKTDGDANLVNGGFSNSGSLQQPNYDEPRDDDAFDPA